MPNKTIKLITAIEGPSGQISEIVLREPKFNDIMILGEPAAFAHSEGGLVYSSEKDGVVRGYIERLLVEPNDPLLLTQLFLADTLQLKGAVFDFFRDARTVS
jgi:hypothetical protein